jgi:hypothetical protein
MQTFEESNKEFQKWFKLAEATLPVQEYSSGMGWHARDVEIEALRAPGPCGKHPAMFWNTKTRCPHKKGTVCDCPPPGYCTLCAELAALQSRIDAGLALAMQWNNSHYAQAIFTALSPERGKT